MHANKYSISETTFTPSHKESVLKQAPFCALKMTTIKHVRFHVGETEFKSLYHILKLFFQSMAVNRNV